MRAVRHAVGPLSRWPPCARDRAARGANLMVSVFLMVAGGAVKPYRLHDRLASLVGPDADRGEARWCEQHLRWECTRRTKRGADVCHGLAVSGTDRCRMHAGEPIKAVRARGQMAIEERVTFARILRETPRRSYEEVLADTVHVFDVKARELLEQIEADETPTPERHAEVADRWERAGRWALRALDHDVRERIAQVSEHTGALIETGLRWLFAELDLADDPRIPVLVPAMLRALAAGRPPEDAAQITAGEPL
jgi:hypothetical protein